MLNARDVFWLRDDVGSVGVYRIAVRVVEGDMGLNVLQLSRVVTRRRGERIVECFLGGMIGAMGALLILAWLL